MIWFKACPRCRLGDLYLDGDDSRRCLQCGYIRYSSGTTNAAPRPLPMADPDDGRTKFAATSVRAAAMRFRSGHRQKTSEHYKSFVPRKY